MTPPTMKRAWTMALTLGVLLTSAPSAQAETKRIARVLRSAPDAAASAKRELFPGAAEAWMHVYGTNAIPIEQVRRGLKPWPACQNGCTLDATPDVITSVVPSPTSVPKGRQILRSIKVHGGQLPVPLPIWSANSAGTGSGEGKLSFDPSLLEPRSYNHVCAYSPTKRPGSAKATGRPKAVTPCCVHRSASRRSASAAGPRPPGVAPPKPASAKARAAKARWAGVKRCKTPSYKGAALKLGMRWPTGSGREAFQFLAITDSCGNARVQPFRTQFEVPVKPMPTGQCGGGSKGVLRIFSEGGQLRVTAFNLDRSTTATVVSETYAVPVPALQDWVSATPPKVLFSDPRLEDIILDCSPRKASGALKALVDKASSPKKAAGRAALKGKTKGGKTMKRLRRTPVKVAKSTSGFPLAQQSLVIGPEPLLRGNCRIEWRSQSKRRLTVPLALKVTLTRTDKATTSPLVDETWLVTPSTGEFRIPQLQGKAGFDGESRLRLEIRTLPNNPSGRAVLVSDAATLSGRIDKTAPSDTGKIVGAVTLHSAPLCGGSKLELPRDVGGCFRFYFTVPAMLATLQVTRAPWVENPIITREVLSSVGVAFAMDSYDPVERRAFPLALQVGGFVQKIGESTALTPYIGLAPTIPFLGDGGNTTSVGLLGGVGMAYLTNTTGPDEGFKPAAFLSVVVQVGQVNPASGAAKQSSFGSLK